MVNVVADLPAAQLGNDFFEPNVLLCHAKQ